MCATDGTLCSCRPTCWRVFVRCIAGRRRSCNSPRLKGCVAAGGSLFAGWILPGRTRTDPVCTARWELRGISVMPLDGREGRACRGRVVVSGPRCSEPSCC
ncbi:hypothetical protein MTO96_020821 [Rhipicephalus appendiculatus]